jgi:hypothetical protein
MLVKRLIGFRAAFGVSAVVLAIAIAAVSAAGAAADTLVSVGSPSSPFPQNKQNEPSVAVDPANPSLVAAGANDEVDNLPCAGSDCSFTPGVGGAAVYLSSDGGQTWLQPTYTGLSGHNGVIEQDGPIGTVPNYEEAGLVSIGDPALQFGPRPDAHGRFSWANGARLYYGSQAESLNAKPSATFAGFYAFAVSHTDDLTAASLGSNAAWSAPVIVTKQNGALFSDKDAVWADNASSSAHFGSVYECNIAYRSSKIKEYSSPLMFTRSTDGGVTFSAPNQLTEAAGNPSQVGRQGCTIRTDSEGTVYVFWEGATGGQPVQMMDRSFDGGVHFERPRAIQAVSNVGVYDPPGPPPTSLDAPNSFDGVKGARTNSFPSVDIANGAPTGADATNVIAMTWSDAREGLNKERALVSLSDDGGSTWTTPANAAAAGDRPDFPAIALAPNGSEVYVVYDAFLQPFQTDTSTPRLFQGVVRAATLSGTAPGSFVTLGRGETGDARASSSNSLAFEFLGDYNYVEATRTQAVAVYNDERRGAFCPAVEAYRDSQTTATPLTKPAPATDCPAAFGNTDIYGGIFTP